MMERNLLVYRRAWMIIFSGFFEPIFYLFSIGIGIGELVGDVAGSAGEPIKYATYPGPSEIISSPVVYNNKVYACIGQDPEHGEGLGAVTCIDPSKGNGEDAIVWQFKEVGRTISTPSIGVPMVPALRSMSALPNEATGEVSERP